MQAGQIRIDASAIRLGRTDRRISRIGLGAMPLSIRGRPDDREHAKRVVRRAVELGVTLIDTADVYCLDDSDIGHNERLIREALNEVDGGDAVLVATKGGLTRPGGRWESDARPEHLRRACERSLAALGVDAIDLYQLHAPDPEVPFEDSVGEIARLRDDGKVLAVGLSNVDAGELQVAREIVEIASVQNRYSPFDRSSETEGIVETCDRERITFLPYSPVGGGQGVQRLRRNAALRRIARRHDATPEEVVLAWMLSKSPSLCPIPGASRIESIESSTRALALHLPPEAIPELERAFETLES
ncbi:MAG: aldo/keto reductase [Gemmatimonadetes bacterium]|nr:aldo/keto reductase [Gemmatimonadota bacterium]